MSTLIDEAALDEVLHSLSGPIQRHVYEQAEHIRLHASTKVNRSDGPGPHLADSSLVEDTAVAGLPGFLIAFESPHAEFYYEGTRPHIIRAKNAKVLAFKWPKMGGGTFFFRAIRHPGTEAHPFLHETVMEMYGVQLV